VILPGRPCFPAIQRRSPALQRKFRVSRYDVVNSTHYPSARGDLSDPDIETVIRTSGRMEISLWRADTLTHSIAAAAPIRRVLRRRSPDPPFSTNRVPDRPGPALGVTPHASMMQACHRVPCPVLAGSSGANRGRVVVGASEFRALLADRHLHVPARPRVSGRATHAQLAGFRIVFREFHLKLARVACETRPASREEVLRGGACAQSGASRSSDSWNARTSPTSHSISASCPWRIISRRLSVARNRGYRKTPSISGAATAGAPASSRAGTSARDRIPQYPSPVGTSLRRSMQCKRVGFRVRITEQR